MRRFSSMIALSMAAMLTLSACNRDRERDGPLIGGEDRVEQEQPEEQPRKSIFREDVDQVNTAPEVLEPLEITVPFANAETAMSGAALKPLREALQSTQFREGGAIALRGHTDSAGRDDANLRASQTRAEQVRDWLMEQGVAEDRITLIAMGEQNPVEPNALPDGSPNDEGRAANRRVDVTIGIPTDENTNDGTRVGDAPAIMQLPAR